MLFTVFKPNAGLSIAFKTVFKTVFSQAQAGASLSGPFSAKRRPEQVVIQSPLSMLSKPFGKTNTPW